MDAVLWQRLRHQCLAISWPCVDATHAMMSDTHKTARASFIFRLSGRTTHLTFLLRTRVRKADKLR